MERGEKKSKPDWHLTKHIQKKISNLIIPKLTSANANQKNWKFKLFIKIKDNFIFSPILEISQKLDQIQSQID